MRCHRCAGTGDVPIITEDLWIHPETRPLLQSCPSCGGTGLQRDVDEMLQLEEVVVEEQPPQRRARR